NVYSSNICAFIPRRRGRDGYPELIQGPIDDAVDGDASSSVEMHFACSNGGVGREVLAGVLSLAPPTHSPIA
ncbi:hypothetical protein Trydic_g19899, partial [Trypoxylus dichotomus]